MLLLRVREQDVLPRPFCVATVQHRRLKKSHRCSLTLSKNANDCISKMSSYAVDNEENVQKK